MLNTSHNLTRLSSASICKFSCHEKDVGSNPTASANWGYSLLRSKIAGLHPAEPSSRLGISTIIGVIAQRLSASLARKRMWVRIPLAPLKKIFKNFYNKTCNFKNLVVYLQSKNIVGCLRVVAIRKVLPLYRKTNETLYWRWYQTQGRK